MVSVLGEILVDLEGAAVDACVAAEGDGGAELSGALGALGQLHLGWREERPPGEIFVGGVSGGAVAAVVGLGGGLGERDDGVRDLERLDLPPGPGRGGRRGHLGGPAARRTRVGDRGREERSKA